MGVAVLERTGAVQRLDWLDSFLFNLSGFLILAFYNYVQLNFLFSRSKIDETSRYHKERNVRSMLAIDRTLCSRLQVSGISRHTFGASASKNVLCIQRSMSLTLVTYLTLSPFTNALDKSHILLFTV